jgi:hypothetical protein
MGNHEQPITEAFSSVIRSGSENAVKLLGVKSFHIVITSTGKAAPKIAAKIASVTYLSFTPTTSTSKLHLGCSSTF